jgi:tetratricopeptide (TPR) repeat protein
MTKKTILNIFVRRTYSGGKMISIILIILTILLSCDLCHSAAGGGQPGQFLQWGAGARSFGMGTAFFSVADDASATYWNPAGLSQINRKEITTLYVSLFPGTDTEYSFISFVYPTPKYGVFGCSITRLFSSGFEKVSIEWDAGEIAKIVSQGTFNDDNLAVTFAYGKKVLENTSIGFSAKYISRTLDVYTDMMVAADMTLLMKGLNSHLPGLNLAFGVKNLIKMEIGENTEDELPMILKMGFSHKFLKDKLTVSTDLEKNLNVESPSWAFGLEYHILNYAALRFGFTGESGAQFRETDMGFGIKYKDYGFDYAFALHEIGASHRISGSWRFGRSIIQNRDALVRRLLQEGTEAYRRGNFLIAYNKLEQAFGIDPTNKEVDKMLNRLKEVMVFIPRATADTEEDSAIRKGVANYVEGEIPNAVNAFRYAYYKNPENAKLLELLNRIEKANGMDLTPAYSEDVVGFTMIDKKLYDARRAVIDGKYDQALIRCQEVLNLEPNNTTSMEVMGSAFFMMNRHDKAKEVWLKVLEVDPTNRVVLEFLEELE